MTLTELRDEAARLIGWECEREALTGPAKWVTMGAFKYGHPIDTTLDGIAALWREHLPGWAIKVVVHRDTVQVTAWNADIRPLKRIIDGGTTVFIEGTNETDARLAAFVAALKSERSKP